MLSHRHLLPRNNTARDGADIIAYVTAPIVTPQTATASRVPKMGKLFLLQAVSRKATM